MHHRKRKKKITGNQSVSLCWLVGTVLFITAVAANALGVGDAAGVRGKTNCRHGCRIWWLP